MILCLIIQFLVFVWENWFDTSNKGSGLRTYGIPDAKPDDSRKPVALNDTNFLKETSHSPIHLRTNLLGLTRIVRCFAPCFPLSPRDCITDS